MHGHIIVCGDDALGMRIVEELNTAGATVLTVQTPDGLAAAGVAEAQAVICADDDDELNLEIALLARQASPDVRVVARLANGVLRDAMARDNGPGAILDVADLAASSVVEACLSRTTHTISVAGIDFVISGADVPSDATLREIYGDLAPVAVIHGENSPQPGEVVACPGRDMRVREGDWTAMIGTADELTAQGIAVPKPLAHARVRRPPLRRLIDAVRMVREDINPMFYRAFAASMTLLLSATLLLRFTYEHPPGMTWIDALYFSTETIATVGYGDFSFLEQPTWLRLFGILLMFAGVTTTAILVAFIADLLLSRRIAQSAGRRKVRLLRHHVIVVGLGSFGVRVVSDLNAAGYDVAVIESDDDNRYLPTAARLDVPVIFGDATLRQTLESARIEEARAVAVLTHNDMVNIEVGIALKGMLGSRAEPEADQPEVPIVLGVRPDVGRSRWPAVRLRIRPLDSGSRSAMVHRRRDGAGCVRHLFGGQRSFMVGGVHVDPASALDGMAMADLSTQTRVIAITCPGEPVRLHPRRDTTLSAGDTAYLVGPYRELLDTLRKGQGVEQTGVTDRAQTG